MISNAEAAAYFQRHREWLMQTIEAYVALETPTAEPDRLDGLAARIEADFAAIGGRLLSVDHHPRPVAAHFGDSTPRVCLIFHHDTVWPVGSFAAGGIRGQRWFGPGIFDMKANLPLAMLSLKWLLENQPEPAADVVVVSSPDEEVMGPVSRTRLPRLVSGCEWALVFEPPLPDGGLKWKRKGVGRVSIRFRGVAAHAGNHYIKGKSALKAAARFLLAAEALSLPEQGFTVNAGLMAGGSAVNTRPARAWIELDVRLVETQSWGAFLRFLQDYRDPDDVALTWEDSALLPPMKAEHEGWDLLADLHRDLGLPFSLGEAGGGSDGNHLAAQGLKVIDGLGVGGGGEHADDEHIRTDLLEVTFLRNTRLLQTLLRGPKT